MEDYDAIGELIKNLDRIPKEVDSKLLIKEIEDELMERLRKKIAV